MLTSQTVSDTTVPASYEALAQALHDDGSADAALVHAASVLDCLVLGSALDARAPIEVWASVPGQISTLAAAVQATDGRPGERSKDSFDIGLACVLAGLERLGTTAAGPS